MSNQRFKPKFDKLYWWILAPCVIYMIVMTAISFMHPTMLIITAAVDLLLVWALVTPWFGYVELREQTVLVKFGLFLKREIPYSKIRKTDKVRRWYSESMLSLKNAMEHVDIRYNSFDVVSVSVVENDALIEALAARIKAEKCNK